MGAAQLGPMSARALGQARPAPPPATWADTRRAARDGPAAGLSAVWRGPASDLRGAPPNAVPRHGPPAIPLRVHPVLPRTNRTLISPLPRTNRTHISPPPPYKSDAHLSPSPVRIGRSFALLLRAPPPPAVWDDLLSPAPRSQAPSARRAQARVDPRHRVPPPRAHCNSPALALALDRSAAVSLEKAWRCGGGFRLP